MAAKVPLIPAGFAATVGVVAWNNSWAAIDPRIESIEFPDFAPAFDNFDPGPAIDADLERSKPQTAPKDERKPVPFKSELRATRATSASAGRAPTTLSIAFNPTPKAPSSSSAQPPSTAPAATNGQVALNR
jgi:hypothetical protein